MTDDEIPTHVDGEPVIDMSVGRATCPVHGEVFRKQWPKGWLLFSVPLVAAVLQSEKFSVHVVGETQEERVAAINATLARTPACTFATDQELRKLYKECGVLTPGICQLCSMPGPGGTLRFRDVTGEREVDQVCLNCIMRIGKRQHAALHGPPI